MKAGWARWVPLLMIAFLAASCRGDGGRDDAVQPSVTVPVATPTVAPTPIPTVDDVPDAQPGVEGEAADLIEVVVGWFNGVALTEAEFDALFAPEFASEVPFSDFEPTLGPLVALGPWVIARKDLSTTTQQAVVINNEARTSAFRLSLAAQSSRIVGLLLEPAPVERLPQETGLAGAVESLNAQGSLRYVLAAIVDGQCLELAGQNPNEAMPLGSVFKLWVLGAVVTAVRTGEFTWHDEVPVSDALYSVPSGTTQEELPGTLLTVRDLATRMIVESDNTATDHLMALVGRLAVAAAQAEMGQSDPDLNVPFLTTREMSILKFGGLDDLTQRYLDATPEQRSAILAFGVGTAELPTLDDILSLGVAPRWIDEIEWFGSALDVCRALVWLTGDETATEILSAQPASPNVELWVQMGFKGGSEPGVLVTAWIVTDREGARFVAVGGLANRERVLDEASALASFAALRDSIRTVTAG